jgi:ZIP family zinc transporter
MVSVLLIVLISVLGPIIGSALGVMGRPRRDLLNSMLAFSGGVMIAISFLELFPEALAHAGVWLAALGFLLGALLMMGLDVWLPHLHPAFSSRKGEYSLRRTALFLIIGIFLHNFPEGMAIAIGSASLNLSIAVAIAVHNIPEGICTSAPYYHATGRRWKSFLLSSTTAVPVVVGFFLGKLLFNVLSATLMGVIAAVTAGLMVYISSDELIPNSCNKNNASWSHAAIFSLIIGVLLVVVLGAVF